VRLAVQCRFQQRGCNRLLLCRPNRGSGACWRLLADENYCCVRPIVAAQSGGWCSVRGLQQPLLTASINTLGHHCCYGWACSSWLCAWWFMLMLMHMCLPTVSPPLNRSGSNAWWFYQGTQCCKWLSKVCAKSALPESSATTRNCNQHSKLPRRSHAWRQHTTYLSHHSNARESPVT
jgi:hypothetical protein